MALVFIVASFFSGALASQKHSPVGTRKAIVRDLFIGSSIAWLVAVITVVLLSITPLCVGQDNGDGVNNLALCVVQVSLAGIAYSPIVLLLTWIASLILSRYLYRSN